MSCYLFQKIDFVLQFWRILYVFIRNLRKYAYILKKSLQTDGNVFKYFLNSQKYQKCEKKQSLICLFIGADLFAENSMSHSCRF